jgi:hypothetical protein
MKSKTFAGDVRVQCFRLLYDKDNLDLTIGIYSSLCLCIDAAAQ